MSNKKNRINIIIYGHPDIVQIDANSFIREFLENMFKKNYNLNTQKTLVFDTEVKLDHEVKFNCRLHATNSEQQLRTMAKNSVGLILIFDPDINQSLELLENLFKGSAKKKKIFGDLYITILANKKKETEITKKAKDFAIQNGIKFCDSTLDEEDKKFILEIIKEICNFKPNKKKEINQKEDAPKENAKKSRDCCGCFK